MKNVAVFISALFFLFACTTKEVYEPTMDGVVIDPVVKPSNTFTTIPSNTNDCVDKEGHVYKTCKIGNQVWMAENLRTLRYQNGDVIPDIVSNAQWSALTTGACSSVSTSASSDTTYGKFYNWYAINDSRNISPVGWHVATSADWNELENFLGGATVAAGKMRQLTTLWQCISSGNNASGFSARPAGARNTNGAVYTSPGVAGLWWCSSVYGYRIDCNSNAVLSGTYNKSLGLSVRCVKN